MIHPAKTADERMVLIGYLASKLGIAPARLVGTMPFEIMAVTRQDQPVGAILYTNKRRHTVEMTWAGETGWLTRGVIRDMFSYPFEQLHCLTALGMVKASNWKSCELAERLGCRRVGAVPYAFGEDEDGILYAMRHDDCRWIKSPHMSAQLMNGTHHG